MTLNKVVGVMDTALWKSRESVWLEPYRPVSVKKILTGNGKAEKDEVMAAVKEYVGDIEFATDDESDAVAVGLCYAIDNGLIESKVKEEDDGKTKKRNKNTKSSTGT